MSQCCYLQVAMTFFLFFFFFQSWLTGMRTPRDSYIQSVYLHIWGVKFAHLRGENPHTREWNSHPHGVKEKLTHAKWKALLPWTNRATLHSKSNSWKWIFLNHDHYLGIISTLSHWTQNPLPLIDRVIIFLNVH